MNYDRGTSTLLEYSFNFNFCGWSHRSDIDAFTSFDVFNENMFLKSNKILPSSFRDA